MELSEIIPHIEALIFASEKPVTSLEITELINNAFGFMEDKITLDQIEAALDGVIEKYRSDFYPFEVRESGGGWQFLTKKEYHKTVAQLNGDKYLKRLSNAALETLSIIAYKQPVTKGEIEAIRGVSADYSIQKLLEKELIIITGRSEDLPGKPLVYATSKSFMDYFGLNSPDDLPKINEVLADQAVSPTVVNDESEAAASADTLAPHNAATSGEVATDDNSALNLVVLENGELEMLEQPPGIPEATEGIQAAEQPDTEISQKEDEHLDTEISSIDEKHANTETPAEEQAADELSPDREPDEPVGMGLNEGDRPYEADFPEEENYPEIEGYTTDDPAADTGYLEEEGYPPQDDFFEDESRPADGNYSENGNPDEDADENPDDNPDEDADENPDDSADTAR